MTCLRANNVILYITEIGVRVGMRIRIGVGRRVVICVGWTF